MATDFRLLWVSLLASICSNVFAANVNIRYLGHVENDRIFVNKDVDLKGKACDIPEGFTIEFKGGTIKNGTLIGTNTKIFSKGKAFDRVVIKGTWNIPQISTSLFVNLSDDNALKNVMALTNETVNNVVIIEKGTYWVAACKESDKCLVVNSNTTLVINGTIRLRANDYIHYNILYVRGENISIKGKGTIIGDKPDHYGDKGEWGMGIRFHEAMNASVSGLTIKDCWGDCIYVGGNSKNVLIEKCILDHGRRQGISVTKADGVTIKDCKISNVSGTNPQYAIDLEPNPNDTVSHILIENVEVTDCEGGFMATTGRKDAEKKHIGKVQIRNCKVSALSKYPIGMACCESLSVEHCIINVKNEKSAIYTRNTRSVVVRNNIINVKKEILSSIKNTVKEIVGKNGFVPINIVQAEQQEVRNNKIVEK